MYGLLKRQAQVTWASDIVVAAKAGLRIWIITPAKDIDLGPVDPRSSFHIDKFGDGTAVVKVSPPIPEGVDGAGGSEAIVNPLKPSGA